MSKNIRRRDFLRTATAALAAPVILTSKASAQSSPSKQVTLGCIGTGGHGISWNMKAFLGIPEARILAVCDVFADRREEARAKVNEAYGNQDCKTYNDFRDVLARDDIDAVVISTPDHWHVLMSIMAARAGKDVFCEKPTLTIEEGQALVDVMKRTGVIYQGGIEDRSVEIYHRMAELVRNGRLGKLERILITLVEGDPFPKEEPVPVPDGLDYDLWLGPAPFAPYTPTRLGRQEWRNIWDYSGGKLTDWGAHLIDTAQVAMEKHLSGPVEVSGKGEFPKDAMAETATTYKLNYRYDNGVEMVVKSGGTGIRFIGSEGWIQSAAWRKPIEASDPELLEAAYSPDTNKMWPRPLDEHHSFIKGVLARKQPYYTPENIHRLSTAMHIGNISMRLDRKLKWDPVRETFPGDDEANAMQSRPMRKPWSLNA